MHGMAIELGVKQDHRAIDGHALRPVHGAGIGPAEPGAPAFIGDISGNETDAAVVDDRFNAADVAEFIWFFGRISMDGGHGGHRAVDDAEPIVAKLKADFVAGGDLNGLPGRMA